MAFLRRKSGWVTGAVGCSMLLAFAVCGGLGVGQNWWLACILVGGALLTAIGMFTILGDLLGRS